MRKKLNGYVTLGRSGLRVSPLCLGTMTFGNEWGWGSEEEKAREVLDRYIEAGGNFIGTADSRLCATVARARRREGAGRQEVTTEIAAGPLEFEL